MLLVQVVVETPTNLTPEAEQLFRKLAELETRRVEMFPVNLAEVLQQVVALTQEKTEADDRRVVRSPALRHGDQGLGARLPALGEEEPAQQAVEAASHQVHDETPAQVLQHDAVDEALGGLEQDEGRRQGDEAAFEGRAEVLDLAVTVGVLLVGRLGGLFDREQRDAGRDQIDARVDRLGDHRHRPHEQADDQLADDQGRVGKYRDPRGPRFALSRIHGGTFAKSHG